MTNLLPLMIMLAGVAMNAEKIQGLIGYSRNVAVQAEVNSITHLIVLDTINGETPPAPEDFGKYLKSNLRVPASKQENVLARDVSKDPFGRPYRIEYPTPAQVKVTSAGQDGIFGTADDVYSLRDLSG